MELKRIYHAEPLACYRAAKEAAVKSCMLAGPTKTVIVEIKVSVE